MQVTLESIAQTIDKNARWADFAPLNFDERAIAYCITFTFAFYLVGALYMAYQAMDCWCHYLRNDANPRSPRFQSWIW